MTRSAAPTTTQINPHTGVTYRAGAATIRVHLTDTDLYRVETTNSTGAVVDAWTRTMPNRETAVATLAHIRAAFNTHGTADAIERRADTLRLENLRLLNIRRPLTTNERRTHAAVNAELDRLADLNDLANTAALNAQFAA